MNTTVDTTNLMTVKQYASHINKSTTWVYELIRKGEVKALKLGSKAGKDYTVIVIAE